MSDERRKDLSRRELFRTAARAAAVGGIGVLALVLRTPNGKPSPESGCVNGFACGACPVLGGCGLPQGASARRAIRKDRP